MKLSAVLSETASLAIPFGSDKLNVTYKPGVYTPEFESRVTAASEGKDTDSLSTMLSGLLQTWDLQDDDGAPVPTDIATLRALPVKLLGAVLKAIVKDFSPNEKTSDNIASG